MQNENSEPKTSGWNGGSAPPLISFGANGSYDSRAPSTMASISPSSFEFEHQNRVNWTIKNTHNRDIKFIFQFKSEEESELVAMRPVKGIIPFGQSISGYMRAREAVESPKEATPHLTLSDGFIEQDIPLVVHRTIRDVIVDPKNLKKTISPSDSPSMSGSDSSQPNDLSASTIFSSANNNRKESELYRSTEDLKDRTLDFSYILVFLCFMGIVYFVSSYDSWVSKILTNPFTVGFTGFLCGSAFMWYFVPLKDRVIVETKAETKSKKK